jgi:hypothetical protein
MLFSSILMVAAYIPRNHLKIRMGHPMVLSVKVWALSHLLANGNLADMLLFGGFLIWAVLNFKSARARDRVQVQPPDSNLELNAGESSALLPDDAPAQFVCNSHHLVWWHGFVGCHHVCIARQISGCCTLGLSQRLSICMQSLKYQHEHNRRTSFRINWLLV